MSTKIQWTEETWNPIAGCSVVSPGCTNCYAMRRTAPRLSKNPATPQYHGTVQPSKAGYVWTGKIGIAGDTAFLKPLRIKKPTMWFVNSMSDLFHENVPDEVVDRVFAIMALCPQHTFQVLTKRPARMRQYMSSIDNGDGTRIEGLRDALIEGMAQKIYADRTGEDPSMWLAVHLPLPNVWLGVSVEDQTRADERIPDLLATPAAIRFISAEPLLGPVDLCRWLSISWQCSYCRGYFAGRYLSTCPECGAEGGWSGSHAFNGRGRPAHGLFPPQSGRGLDWVIVGGESGSGARPMHPDWTRDIRDQCAGAGVPFFFKQWGNWLPWEPEHGPCWKAQNGRLEDHHALFPVDMNQDPKWDDGLWAVSERLEHFAFQNVGTKDAGRKLDGVEHNGMPGLPRVPHDLATGEIG